MEIPKDLMIEGQKSIEIKHKINEILAYLTAEKEAEASKVELPSEVNTYRLTLQTAQVPYEPPAEDEVPVGTVVETSEKMVKVKRQHGWDALTKENWAKESDGK